MKKHGKSIVRQRSGWFGRRKVLQLTGLGVAALESQTSFGKNLG
jgi:hypothetical protein